MDQEVRNLEPRALWNHFADLNAVPRPSKKEARIVAFVKAFGERLGLKTSVDDCGNVVIRKPATKGMEDRLPIVMQAHLDMVHQKNASTAFDFDEQGIEMFVDDDWVRARGTTLGADNGIGVASIMTVLASDNIAHPPLEALFTVDEETGMTGAQRLRPGWLHGKILLNLDTEEDNELTIGCAGGCDVTIRHRYSPEPIASGVAYQVTVRGLTGGHSGVDIHLGRANANKLMNRLLWNVARVIKVRISSIDGGGLRNAIPRESVAVVVIPEAEAQAFEELIGAATRDIRSEYASTDPHLEVAVAQTSFPGEAIPETLQASLLASVYACLSGIYRMCPDIEGLVQTSNNLSRVLVHDGQCAVFCLTRSSVNSERDDLAHAIQAVFELTGANVEISGAYPGWQPAPSSAIVTLMSNLHDELFGERPRVAACHAGLECGIIGQHYPGMDMISFGPTIRGPHSPDERVSISSVQKYWRFLNETLRRIPAGTSAV